MIKLLFIRHGETEFNKLGKTMGQICDESLNQEGVEQAEQVSQGLPQDIDIIFFSPLKRAKETAEIINRYLNKPFESRDELKERNYGSLSGKTWENIAVISKIENIYELDKTFRYDYRPFGGESVEEVKSRLLRFIEELKSKYDGKKVLIVTHGGLIRIMHNIFPQKERPIISNASVHEFEI